MIHETVVTTLSKQGTAHVAPMGVRFDGNNIILMPFRPSLTYDNIIATRCAVVNFTTDVRVFAGCVTGRRDWPTLPAREVPCVRLAGALAHAELRLTRARDDPLRPTLTMQRVVDATHGAFTGFNRAQAAVIEGAVLVSRLHLLPREKIDAEIAYLKIAVDKTAGPAEHEAWQWLTDAIAAHYESDEPAHQRALS
ncbi:DUF447 domain-containing protein [Paraburkholderia aromaticivorans]|uniref:DUF447 domain-containing protein n=1 Tax=Paraburkholderia aromaticivorans TaxID=2026199 RepID=UPI001455E12D|nr:DUF447 domain-containing protein [Paraburkholderia aromaticivorans]